MCFWVIQSTVFNVVIGVVVFLNLVVLGAAYYNEPSSWERFRDNVSVFRKRNVDTCLFGKVTEGLAGVQLRFFVGMVSLCAPVL
jgi:hypothetical protein